MKIHNSTLAFAFPSPAAPAYTLHHFTVFAHALSVVFQHHSLMVQDFPSAEHFGTPSRSSPVLEPPAAG